jgi:hypothetical protein
VIFDSIRQPGAVDEVLPRMEEFAGRVCPKVWCSLVESFP